MRTIFTCILILGFSSALLADDKLAGIACRSVHLGYDAKAGSAFAIEATVKQSAEGTYFCAIGFNAGYFGIQELANGKKLVIFSVWDPTKGDDKNAVPADQRVTMLFKDDAVRVGRFGGEGTGGQSFFDYDWKVNETYRFLVHAEADPKDDKRTAYTGYFGTPDSKTWRKLITFSTLAKSKSIRGYYSFVEDFRRNKISATKQRVAEYGNAWSRSETGEWTPVSQAKFTADSNPALTIDAGMVPTGDRWFLKTGGKTENTTTKLKESITLTKPGTAKPENWPFSD